MREIIAPRNSHFFVAGLPVSVQWIIRAHDIRSHSGFVPYAKGIDFGQRELPAVYSGKPIGIDPIWAKLRHARLEFFGSLIQVDHINKVNIVDLVTCTLVCDPLQMVFKLG